MTHSTAATPTIEFVRAAMRGSLPGFEAQITMAPRPRPFSPPPGVEPRRRALGGRDHTTVLYGVRQVSDRIEQDEILRREVLAIRKLLYNNGSK